MSAALPGIGFFLGALVGEFAGSLFGSLFSGPPSVGPNAVAIIGLNTVGSFAVKSISADNGGNTAVPLAMAQAEIDIENKILTLIGGTLANSRSVLENQTGYGSTHSIGYFQNQYFYAPGVRAPANYPNRFNDQQSAIEFSIMKTMRGLSINGGNDYMRTALVRSKATTLNDFASDLNAANDYSIYVKNPLAFDVALASSNSPTAWANWNAELVRVQALGLDKLSHGELVVADPVTVLTAAVKSVVINGNAAGSEIITPAAGAAFNVILAASLDLGSLWYGRTGNDLTLNFFGSGHTSTIQNWFTTNTGLLQSIVAPGGNGIGSDVITTLAAADTAIAPMLTGGVTAAGTVASDSKVDFFATGQASTLVQTAGGKLGLVQLDPSGAMIARLWLTDAGSAAVLPTGATFVGSAQLLFGAKNDLLVKTAQGQLQVWEIDISGAITKWDIAASGLAVTNKLINILKPTNLTLIGDSNTVIDASGDAVTVFGSSRTSAANHIFIDSGSVYVGANSNVEVKATNSNVNATGNDAILLLAGSNNVAVAATSSTITVDNAQGAVTWSMAGSGNIINAGTSVLTIAAGTTNTINSAGASIFQTNGTGLTINGVAISMATAPTTR